eukprot:2472045-Amphidinium_carterae.1
MLMIARELGMGMRVRSGLNGTALVAIDLKSSSCFLCLFAASFDTDGKRRYQKSFKCSILSYCSPARGTLQHTGASSCSCIANHPL